MKTAGVEYDNEILNYILKIIKECGIEEYYENLYKDVSAVSLETAEVFIAIGAESYEVRHFLDQLRDGDYTIEEDDDEDNNIILKIPNSIEVVDKYMNHFALRLNQLYSYDKLIENLELSYAYDSKYLKTDENCIIASVIKLVNIIANDFGLFDVIKEKTYNLTSNKICNVKYAIEILKTALNAFIVRVFGAKDQITTDTFFELSRKYYAMENFIKIFSKMTDKEIMYVIENGNNIDLVLKEVENIDKQSKNI